VQRVRRAGERVWLTALRAVAAPLAGGTDLPRAALAVEAGWDDAPALGLRGAWRPWDHVRAEVGARVPVVLAPGAWELTGGLATVRALTGAVGVRAEAHTGLARASDVTGVQLGWVVDLGASPGWYRANAHVAADLGWRGSVATHLHHSDTVRALFDDRYPGSGAAGPRDGWYALGAHGARFGARAGGAVGPVGIGGAAGFAWTRQRGGLVGNGMLGEIPFYGTLEVAWSWGR
jgi:hypothetical protein